MIYNLIISEKAEELLDNLVYYILHNLKNKNAAKHLLTEVGEVYDRLEENPYQFAESVDEYLAVRGYKEAHLPTMRYVIMFYVENNNVYISGIYHELELYTQKIKDS